MGQSRELGWVMLGVLGSAGLAGCAIPHGSYARPVEVPAEDTLLLSGGVMVPFAVAFGTNASGSFGQATTNKLALIPGAAFDYSWDEGFSFGIGVEAFTSATLGASGSGSDFIAVFVDPRFEIPLDGPDRRLSLTIDTNLGFLRSGTGESLLQVPYFSPTVGLRAYIPTGFGGPVISQQIGTGIVTVIMPGSLAYDFPIPIGPTARLHVYPEVRWDPTAIFTGSGSGFFVFLSGGLSLMFEL